MELATVDADRGVVIGDAAVDVHCGKGGADSGVIGRIDLVLEDLPGDSAIHGSGIDHGEANGRSEATGYGAFAGCGRTIDGHGTMGRVWRGHGCLVLRDLGEMICKGGV